MKNILGFLATIIILGVLAYGGWTISRTVNYNLFYKSSVQTQLDKAVQPLQAQITTLSNRVWVLENKR